MTPSASSAYLEFILHHGFDRVLTIFKGRSPYEAPENTTAELTGPAQRSVSRLHGDGYVQQYDERGHPVNVESKALGRDLRRAKNDILSTMGIVVSGKDGNAVVSNEQHNVDLITAENDYGLIMATLDQILVFVGSWWTTSLAGRIQVSPVPFFLDYPLLILPTDLQALY